MYCIYSKNKCIVFFLNLLFQNKIVHKRRLNDVKAEDIEKENEVDDVNYYDNLIYFRL